MVSRKIVVAQRALTAASEHIRKLFGKSVHEIGLEYKVQDGDTPRTLIDRHAEQAILAEIRSHPEFVNDSINAEESGEASGSSRVWHIDPYDGTSNAQINLPCSTTGIGIVEEGELVGSVIAHPFEETMFYAEKGAGAFSYRFQSPLSSNRIQTDLQSSDAKSRFAWVDALFNNQTSERKLEWILKMREAGFFQNVRMTGSNIDYSTKIAQGRGHYQLTDAVGGFFDLCGYNLIEEAGGKMINLDGRQPTPKDHVVVAVANPADLEKVLDITNACYRGYEGFR